MEQYFGEAHVSGSSIDINTVLTCGLDLWLAFSGKIVWSEGWSVSCSNLILDYCCKVIEVEEWNHTEYWQEWKRIV